MEGRCTRQCVLAQLVCIMYRLPGMTMPGLMEIAPISKRKQWVKRNAVKMGIKDAPSLKMLTRKAAEPAQPPAQCNIYVIAAA